MSQTLNRFKKSNRVINFVLGGVFAVGVGVILLNASNTNKKVGQADQAVSGVHSLNELEAWINVEYAFLKKHQCISITDPSENGYLFRGSYVTKTPISYLCLKLINPNLLTYHEVRAVHVYFPDQDKAYLPNTLRDEYIQALNISMGHFRKHVKHRIGPNDEFTEFLGLSIVASTDPTELIQDQISNGLLSTVENNHGYLELIEN